MLLIKTVHIFKPSVVRTTANQPFVKLSTPKCEQCGKLLWHSIWVQYYEDWFSLPFGYKRCL